MGQVDDGGAALRRIYLASSWRNAHQPAVLDALRSAGHEVYDFRNPPNRSGFGWEQLNAGWLNWTTEQYVAALEHPIAQAGFGSDFDAMKWADTGVLLLPCGRSAHLEAGYFTGAGKELHILLLERQEPELMYLMATSIALDVHGLIERLTARRTPGAAQEAK